jgi:hypothetical protein
MKFSSQIRKFRRNPAKSHLYQTSGFLATLHACALRLSFCLGSLTGKMSPAKRSFAAPLIMICSENPRKSQLKNKSAKVKVLQFLLVHHCNCRWHSKIFMFHRLCLNKSLPTLPFQSLPFRFLVSLIITDITINAAFRKDISKTERVDRPTLTLLFLLLLYISCANVFRI